MPFDNLKALLGIEVDEKTTVEDLEKASVGKKLLSAEDEAVLEKKSKGGYVDADKYGKAAQDLAAKQKEFDDFVSGHKDYDSLKKELDAFKQADAKRTRDEKLTSLGVKKEYLDFVDFQIAQKKLDLGEKGEKTEEAIGAFLKDNPQYGAAKAEAGKITPPTPQKTVVISTSKVDGQQTASQPTDVRPWNKNKF